MTNENPDPNALPDHLHSSQNGTVFPVYAVMSDAPLNVTSIQDGMIIIYNVTSPTSNFTYFRFKDFTNGYCITLMKRELISFRKFELVSVTRSDGKLLDVNNNVWRTSKTVRFVGQPEVEEDLLHILDYDAASSYSFIFSGFPPPSLNVSKNWHVFLNLNFSCMYLIVFRYEK